MAKALSSKDLYSLIAINSNINEKTAEKVFNKIIDIIISELQYNEKVVFENFGKFEVIYKGGKDELIPNEFGILEKKFVEPKMSTNFIPSTNFIKRLNDVEIDKFNKVSDSNELFNYENFILGKDSAKNTSELINSLLNKKQEKFKRQKLRELTGQKTKQGKTIGNPVLCVTNNKIYPSMRQASFDLDLSIANIKKSIEKGEDTFGYSFKKITQKEYEERLEKLKNEIT